MRYQQHSDLAVSENWVPHQMASFYKSFAVLCFQRTTSIGYLGHMVYTAKNEWDIYDHKCPQEMCNINVTQLTNFACNRDMLRTQEYNSDAMTLTFMRNTVEICFLYKKRKQHETL